MTSRNEIDITRAFEGLPQWKIGEDDVALDIEGFIRAELATCIKTKKLKLRNQVLEDIIAKSLVEGAKGMFQWAKCQIEQLCKLRTDNAIRAALKDLPKTLHDTYFRILERIQGQSEDEIRSVQRLLRWLVRGARNLTLEELAECISIEMDGEDEHMDFDNVPTDAEDILEQCGSLLSISVDNYVTITHYSAKEFLVSEDLKKRMPEFWVGGNEVDSELATVCLKYLCYDDFAGGAFDNNDAILAKLDEYKALKYASQFWALHASRSKSDPQQSTSVVDLTMRPLRYQRSKAQELPTLEADILFQAQCTPPPHYTICLQSTVLCIVLWPHRRCRTAAPSIHSNRLQHEPQTRGFRRPH